MHGWYCNENSLICAPFAHFPNVTNAPFVFLKPFNINRHLLSFLFSIAYSTISIVNVSYKKIETIVLIRYWNLFAAIVYICIKNEEKHWSLFRSLRYYQLRDTPCIIDLVFCLWFLLRDDQTFFSRTYRTLHDLKKTAMLLSILNQRILTFFGLYDNTTTFRFHTLCNVLWYETNYFYNLLHFMKLTCNYIVSNHTIYIDETLHCW